MEARRGSSFIQHFDKLAFDWLTAGVAKSHEICEFCLRGYFHTAVEKKISLDLCRCPGGKKAEELSLSALGWTCGEGLASSLAWKKHLDFWGKHIPPVGICVFISYSPWPRRGFIFYSRKTRESGGRWRRGYVSRKLSSTPYVVECSWKYWNVADDSLAVNRFPFLSSVSFSL